MAKRPPDSPQPATEAVLPSGAPFSADLGRAAALTHLRVWLTGPAWTVLIAVVLFAHFFPSAALQGQFWPFLIGMVCLGLPHGALDHLAPLFLMHKGLTASYLARFVLGYGALVALYLVFWHLSPLVALSIFLLCSWLHWGQGDGYFLHVFCGQPLPKSTGGRFLIWAVRGGLPILLPPLAHPHAFMQVTDGILAWYGGHTSEILPAPLRVAGFVFLGGTIAAYLWQSWKLDEKGFWRDAGEIALLAIYFVSVPAILAVGVYFCVWHSARHIARLMLLDDADQKPLARGRIGQCILRSAAQAVPMTLGALIFLAGLYWWQGKGQVSTGSFVFLYLSLIAALTFPHFLLVLWMDREEFRQDRADPIVVRGRGNSLGDRF